MAVFIDREILTYLSQPDNLALTFEIAAYATQVRRDLLTEFFAQLDETIHNSQPSGFNADEFFRRNIGGVDAAFAGTRWVPKAAAGQRENLAVTIEHYSAKDEHSIYLGLRWNTLIRPSDPIYSEPAVHPLRDRLVGSGGFEPSSEWWMCWRYIHQFVSPDDFLCTYVKDRAAILTPLASAFWNLAIDVGKELDKINAFLARR